jgi:hypothetical protein
MLLGFRALSWRYDEKSKEARMTVEGSCAAVAPQMELIKKLAGGIGSN